MNKLSVIFTGLLCCLAVSLSAQSIMGKWKFEFPSDEGTMIMSAEMKSNGTYALDYGNDGSVEMTGKFTQDGDLFTISDDAGDCTGKGVYKIKVAGDTLTMTKVSDECSNRGGPEGIMIAKKL